MGFSSYYYNFVYGVHLRKPRLTWRIAKNYLRILIKHEVLLRYVDINVDLKCNLTCQHCFAENFKVDGKTTLTAEEWTSVFRQCHDLGNLAVAFTGGEPLMDKRLEDLVRLARPQETLVVVCTNGMLVTPERAKSLYDAGVDVLQISVESMIPEEHNEFRENPKAWSMTMEGIDNALAAGLKVTVVPTVSHMNIGTPGFLDLLEWAHEKRLLINLALATPMGSWNGRMDVLLTKEDFATLDRLAKKYPNVRRDFETNYVHRGCGAATEKLYFTPFGDTLACPYMHITFGNVRDTPVAQIREKMLSVEKLDGYYPKCLVAEDREFIQGPLAAVFDKDDRVVDWRDVFETDEERAEVS